MRLISRLAERQNVRRVFRDVNEQSDRLGELAQQRVRGMRLRGGDLTHDAVVRPGRRVMIESQVRLSGVSSNGSASLFKPLRG